MLIHICNGEIYVGSTSSGYVILEYNDGTKSTEIVLDKEQSEELVKTIKEEIKDL